MPHARNDRAVRARDQRRQQLLEAATRVFARKGYWSASITDIIQTAGVARGTFYLYFRSKQDIFVAIVDHYREEQKHLLRESGPEEGRPTPEKSRARIRAVVLSWLQFYLRNLDAANIIRDANRIDSTATRKRDEVRRALHSAIAKNIARLQEAGVYQRKVPPELAARFVLGMFDEIAVTCLQSAKKSDLARLADQFVEFELHGLSAQ
jgi:TetR/AcrR family fatty acid metabolism transcriptional regulator